MLNDTENFRNDILALANVEKSKILSQFFKTGKGEYGEGDIFIGVTVPNNRTVARRYMHLPPTLLISLLQEPIHELRLAALLCMVEQYKSKKTTESRRQEIFDTYINHTEYINNWDLVDLSVYNIVGAHLYDRDKSLLYHWAQSNNLWEQRMAIVATMYFIRKGEYNNTLSIATILLQHHHDLIHKAVGWLLREVGKHNQEVLLHYLDEHYRVMPRTMLRYAIERLNPDMRKKYMAK